VLGLKFACAVLALICGALVAPQDLARAVTVEVAKKCEALTAKAFPPRVVGNPAAGSAKGTGRVQQAYFTKCLATGGKMDADAAKGLGWD
jgi:hypothetical protein